MKPRNPNTPNPNWLRNTIAVAAVTVLGSLGVKEVLNNKSDTQKAPMSTEINGSTSTVPKRETTTTALDAAEPTSSEVVQPTTVPADEPEIAAHSTPTTQPSEVIVDRPGPGTPIGELTPPSSVVETPPATSTTTVR